MKSLPQSWFEGAALDVAPKLLGKIVRKGACEGVIVEVEAYGMDPASHAAKMTKRGAPMRDTYGHWYIYFTYGMHWCANITTHRGGVGGVLIRAVEPIAGIPLMKRRRKTAVIRKLTSGPACFTQAFGVGPKERGSKVGELIQVFDAPEIAKAHIGASPRIGVSAGKDLPWRFFIKGNPFVSGPSRLNGKRQNDRVRPVRHV